VIGMPQTNFGVGAASAARRGCSGLHTTDVRDAAFLRRTEILGAWSECRPLAETETALLIERGVPARAIRRDANGAGYPLRVAEVEFEGASFWFASERPGAGVAPATIVVLRDEAGDVADIGALQIRTGLHATWLGATPMFGEHNLLRPRFDPLWVAATPLEWLIARRDAILITCFEKAAWRLADVGSLAVADARFTKEIERRLTIPGPPVHVRSFPSSFGWQK